MPHRVRDQASLLWLVCGAVVLGYVGDPVAVCAMVWMVWMVGMVWETLDLVWTGPEKSPLPHPRTKIDAEREHLSNPPRPLPLPRLSTVS